MSTRSLIITVAAWGAIAASAQAGEIQAGPRFDVSDNADLGLGADVLWTFLPRDPRLALTGSFDYFFPDNGSGDLADAVAQLRALIPGDLRLPLDLTLDFEIRYWEANLNLTWDFTDERAMVPYAGVGVNYGRSRSSALGFHSDQSDVGANVLAGVRIEQRFYVEAKKEAGGGKLFVLTAGVRF